MYGKGKINVIVIVASLITIAIAHSAMAVSLELNNQGLVITDSRAIRMNLSYPQLVSDHAEVYKVLSVQVAARGRKAVLSYADGQMMEVRIVDKTNVVFACSHLRSDVNVAKAGFHIPYNGFMNGGGWSFSDGTIRPFPKTLGQDPYLFKGNTQVFTLVSGMGDGIRISFPTGTYQQLQDNRQWKWHVFGWFASVPIGGHSKDEFTVRFSEPRGQSDRSTQPSKRVDRFGQSTQARYAGKVTDIQQLKQDITREQAHDATLSPPRRGPYGGLIGSRREFGLKATGFFHIAKAGSRQVLVTPAGNVFYELGVCGFPITSGSDATTKIEGRRDIYAWLPAVDGPYASAFRTPGEFSFYLANWIRKYGGPFDSRRWTEQNVKRLHYWGFNSAGAFGGSNETMLKMNLPHVRFLPLQRWRLKHYMIPELKNSIFDPFAKGIKEKLDQLFKEYIAPNAKNPLIIGYYLANEQPFEDIADTIPRLKSGIAAKRRLVQFLKERYATINDFNKAWNINATGFNALGDASLPVTTAKAAEDMQVYRRLFLKAYYQVITETFHKYDTYHLLLGNRWQPRTANDATLCQVAGKYMDVISVNYYTYGMERGFLDRIHHNSGGKPMLLSEFSYGTNRTGLAGGVRDVPNQRDRGLAYRNYVETAASTNYIVGTEWFAYVDQALTGRWFQGYHGENMNVGLINVVDQPYQKFLAECIKTNYGIYDVVLGRRKPYHYDNPLFNGGQGQQRKTVLIPHANGPIEIDGAREDWSSTQPPYHIGANQLVGGNDADHISADFQLAWDDQNLYVFVKVQDPTPMHNNQVGDGIWNGDAVELFFGPDQLHQGGHLLYNDRQLIIRSSNQGSSADAYHWYHSPRQLPCRVAVKPSADAKGYMVEAAISLKALGIKAQEGVAFLIDVGIDDGNQSGRRVRQFMWNGTARNSGDRSGWGKAILAQ